jgi:hypothetical protein
MFCKKCGSPVKEGELFCSVCGDKIETAQPAQYAAQPIVQQQPYAQPVYQQQPYQQLYQPPYGQPYGQPGGQPPRKKSKALLWVIIGIIAALAVAAVLIFVVFPTGGNWPFAGNTTQTKFVNDNFKVLAESFSGMGGDTFKRIAKEPFDLKMDITASVAGQDSTSKIDAAYDNESLGLRIGQGTEATVVALIDDVLYYESYGTTNGIRFDTKTDLSKPMPLEDRVKALFESYSSQAAATKIDFGKIAEMLVNSIDAGCFKKSGDTTTLTLSIDDIIQTIKNFSKKLENDKQMLEDLNDYIKQVSSAPVDVSSVLDMAASALEAQKGSLNFKLVWEVKYRDNVPASFVITFDDGTSEYAFEYGYKRDGAKTEIDFSVTAADVAAATGTISYERKDKGISYNADITAGGQTVTIAGSEESSGDKTNGQITMNAPGSGEVSVKYDETLTFGKTPAKVANDDRFKVDTQNATVYNLSEMMNPLAISGAMGDPSAVLPTVEESDN